MRHGIGAVRGRPPERTKTLVIGAEYDQELRGAVVAVLRQLGARATRWRVRGLGDVQILKAQVRSSVVLVEADYGVGLQLTGEESLVDEIAEDVRQALGRTKKLTWPDPKFVRLGNANDAALRAAVRKLLLDQGARIHERADPPNLARVNEGYDFDIAGSVMRYEEDSRRGTTLFGDAEQVDELSKQIREELLRTQPGK